MKIIVNLESNDRSELRDALLTAAKLVGDDALSAEILGSSGKPIGGFVVMDWVPESASPEPQKCSWGYLLSDHDNGVCEHSADEMRSSQGPFGLDDCVEYNTKGGADCGGRVWKNEENIIKCENHYNQPQEPEFDDSDGTPEEFDRMLDKG